MAVMNPTVEAKSWHYHITSSNSFSSTHYNRAFLYGGYDTSLDLYSSANAAKSQNDYYYEVSLSDDTRDQTYYAKRIAGFSNVYQVRWDGKTYYGKTGETKFYRYNTWRSGHKLISLVKPTNTKYIMLKAHTHFHKSQLWYYNYMNKVQPDYMKYKLSKHNTWKLIN